MVHCVYRTYFYTLKVETEVLLKGGTKSNSHTVNNLETILLGVIKLAKYLSVPAKVTDEPSEEPLLGEDMTAVFVQRRKDK